MALGTYVGGIADPQIVEIIGHAGFDAAFIDLEHTSFDLRDVQLMVMAAERVGITPVVRTPGFDPAFILRLLDMGVQGIQLPHVNDAKTARAAVAAVRYAPLGERGMASGTRASDFGKVPAAEHMAQSNREIMLAIMIEELSALNEIEEIASTEGIDLVVVGPADMSRALGVSGQTNHPKLIETIDRVADVVRKSLAWVMQTARRRRKSACCGICRRRRLRPINCSTRNKAGAMNMPLPVLLVSTGGPVPRCGRESPIIAGRGGLPAESLIT